MNVETIESRFVDKSGWGDGPWQHEPDRRQWADQASGLPCLAIRHPEMGNWCGYVGVLPDHPWHGRERAELDEFVTVHGRLTFAGPSDRASPRGQDSIWLQMGRHVPGLPELWWFGFDCAHAWDRIPGMEAFMRRHALPDLVALDKLIGGRFKAVMKDCRYRDLLYVEGECERLAGQAAEGQALAAQAVTEVNEALARLLSSRLK